ncbi:TPA: replication initiation protein [Pseudomonas aeruginosa]
MECLKLFEEYLPNKPYCADDFDYGISPRSKNIAIKKLHIQPNGPTHLRWLTFDIDLPNSGLIWDEKDMPAPNISIMNPINGHSHYLYLLDTPVKTTPDGSSKAIRYASAIQNSLRKNLDADLGFAGLITKNPLNKYWKTKIWRNEPYTLGELSDYLDISREASNQRQENYGLGRNSNLFDDLRHYAYKEILKADYSYNAFFSKCLDFATQLNRMFSNPLDTNEVKSISKSVSKFTFNKFSREQFSNIQSIRGSLKGKDKREEGIEMLKNGYKTKDIMEKLNVDRTTIFRWSKLI